MALLLKCPLEIQDAILKDLTSSDLCSMSLACKFLHALVEPILYATVQTSYSQGITRLDLLLRTIIDKPVLAGHIRSFHLKHDNGAQDLWPKVPKLQMDEAARIISRTKVPHVEDWLLQLRYTKTVAFITLLLIQTPNLTSLNLELGFLRPGEILGPTLSCALCNSGEYELPRYRYLRDVSLPFRITGPFFEEHKNTTNVLSMFYLPNLRTLSAAISNPLDFSWPAEAPVCTSLKSLRLSQLRERRLEPLFLCLKGLQKLHWYCWNQHGVEPEIMESVIRLDKITAALYHVRHTLRDLTIEASGMFQSVSRLYTHQDITLEGSMDGLTSLHRLKRLQVPWLFLMGSFSSITGNRIRDGVPENVETLVLTGDLKSHISGADEPDAAIVFDAITEELEYRITIASSLRVLSLDFMDLLPFYHVWGADKERHRVDRHEIHERRKIDKLAAEAGIKIVWP